MEITYTETEKLLKANISHIGEVADRELEDLADTIDRGLTVWVNVELGRCPTTDKRTYILCVYYSKPKYDYTEEINLDILRKGL